MVFVTFCEDLFTMPFVFVFRIVHHGSTITEQTQRSATILNQKEMFLDMFSDNHSVSNNGVGPCISTEISLDLRANSALRSNFGQIPLIPAAFLKFSHGIWMETARSQGLLPREMDEVLNVSLQKTNKKPYNLPMNSLNIVAPT